MQRPVSTIHTAQDDMQHIDEVLDIPALTQKEVPTIPDADGSVSGTRLQTKIGLSMRTRRGSFPCQSKQSSKAVRRSAKKLQSG